ncbi:MAG: type II toxin-antitoxin system HicB family antitoxin [Saprospiraceae bacterium]
MDRKIDLTVVVEKDDNAFVALCPELDIVSQGETSEKAKLNLHEALQLFFEFASEGEIVKRLNNKIEITTLTVTY